MEALEEFVKRFSKSIECFYHINRKPRLYSIKKFNTMIPNQMKNIGWTGELIRKNKFYICTYNEYANRAGVIHLAAEIKIGNRIFQKEVEVFFYVEKGSIGHDFENACAALKAIKDIR
jgi:hypothetical protein